MAGLFGAALMLAPPPASADRDDWEDDGWGRPHHRHHRHHRDHDDWYEQGGPPRRHGEWCPPRHARPYVVRTYEPGYYYAPPRPIRHARYYCEPCGHWYDDEGAFHAHVHRHHHVPLGLIPIVIAATVFGAVFAGAAY